MSSAAGCDERGGESVGEKSTRRNAQTQRPLRLAPSSVSFGQTLLQIYAPVPPERQNATRASSASHRHRLRRPSPDTIHVIFAPLREPARPRPSPSLEHEARAIQCGAEKTSQNCARQPGRPRVVRVAGGRVGSSDQLIWDPTEVKFDGSSSSGGSAGAPGPSGLNGTSGAPGPAGPKRDERTFMVATLIVAVIWPVVLYFVRHVHPGTLTARLRQLVGAKPRLLDQPIDVESRR